MVFFPVRAAEGPRSTGVAQSAVTLEHRQVPLLVRREEHLETGGCSDVSPMRRISPDPSSLAGREGKAYPGPDEYDRLEGYFSEPRRTFSMCSSAADESLWSAHIPGGVRVPPSFYCTVGDQLRSIQALCDKQKAQALRSPVEAACSQDASVLSFARSLAATLSSALSSPLVLVCAYDHETDELYCCPASLPLHEHGFSSHAFQQTSHRPNRLSSSSPPVSPRGQVPSSSSPFRHGQNPGHLFPSPPALWPGSSRTPLPSSFPPFPFSVQSSPDRLLLWGRGGGPGPPPFFPVHLGAAAYRAAAAQQLGLAGVPANDIATYFARPFSPRVSFSLFDIRKHDVRAQDRKRSCAQEPPCGLEDNRKIQTNQTQHGETLEKTHQEDEEKKKKASKRRGFFSRRKEKEKSTEKGSSATVGAESSSPGETPHAVTGDEKDAESEGIPGRPQDVGGKEDATRNDAGDKPTAASVGEQDDQPVWLASWQEEEDLIAWQLRQFLRWRMLDDRYAADSVSFSTSRYPRLMSFQRGVLPPSSSAVGVVAAATVEGDSGDSVGGTSSSARVPHPSEKDANSPSHSNASAVVPSGGGRLSLATAMVEKQHQQPPTPGLVPRSFERLGGVGDALHSESARGRKTSGGEGGPGTAELPQSGGRGQDAIRATTGEQDEEEEELRILFSQEREALVLSPTSGCIGRLFQECRDRSAIYLYDSTTDSIVWPESASASAPVEYSTNTIVPQASSQTRGGPSSSSSVPQVSSFSNLPVTPSPSSSSSSSGVGSSSFASSSNAVHLQQPASRCDSISVSTAAAAAPTRPESSGPPEEDVPHIRVTGTSEAKSNVGGTGSYATTAIPVSSTGGESGGLSAAASALPKLSNSHPSSPSFPPPPLCLFVRRLEDRSGSRLWRWIEDTRIDYTLPSQKKRNLAPLSQVTHGPFCRFADRPWASSAYAHGSLTSPPLSVAGGGGEAVTPPPTSPVRNGSADSPGPRKSGDRGGSGGQGGGATESSVINEKGKPKRHGSPHKGFSFSPSGRTAGFLKTLAGSVVPLKEPTTALAAQQHAEGRHLVVGGRTESGAKSSRYNWLRVIQRKETITSLSARSTPRSASWESGINVAGGGEGLQVKDFGSSFSGTALGGIAAASASSTESRVSRGEAVGNHPSGAGGVGSTTGIQREDSSPSRQHSGPVVEGTSMLSEQWRSVSPRKNQQLLGAGAEVEEVQAGVPMGLVICVQPLSSGVLDGTQQQLMDALGASVEQLLLSVLQVEWLRRDRTKKALQLELHRTVFQESLNPVKKVERLLSLVHTTLSAEQVAFFIVDAQNNSFVCLGGALKARGLTLPYSHPLLGEATRQGGRIVICNDVPPGLNKEYDSLAMINTRAAVLVPLLNAQGFVKALLLLINRCVCNLPMAYYRDSPSPATPSPLHHPMWGGGPSARMHASVGVPTTPDGTPLLVYSPSAPTAASHTRRDTLENFLTGNPRGSFLPPGGGNSPTGGRGGGGLKRASTDLSATLGSIDGGGGEFRCSCPACSPLERQRLSYGDQLLQSLSVGNVLKISHKFTKEDEVYLRCIQCEIQNALGGALTNVCVAGMTLLKPMVTMVSYVVGERDNALLRPSADADQVLAEIQTIVEEDKRQLLRRLRRCQSLAPELDELAGGLRYLKRAGVSSPSSMASDAEGRRKKKGRDEKNLGDERGFPRRRGIEESKSISLIRSSRGGGFFSTEDGDVPLLPHSVSAACNGSLERDAISAFRAQRMPGGMPCSLQRYNTAPCPSRSWKLKSRDGSFPWSVSADTDAEGETDFALQSQQENGVEAGVVVGEGTPHGRDILSERSVLSRYPRQGRGGGGGGEEEEEGGDDGILFRSGTFFGTRDEEDEEEDDRRGFTPSQGAWRPMAAALNGYAEQRAEKRWMTMTGARGSATLRHADSEETGGEGGKGRKGVSEILRKGQTPEESRDMRVGAKTGLPPGASIAAVPVGRTNTALSQKTVGGHRRVTRRRRRASSLPSLVFSAALSKCERHMKAIRKDLILAQYRGWSLDVWRRSSHDMELFFLLALDDLRLLERKEEKKLRQFFATIRDGYHTDNPYHNFYHAIHVFQMCWMFLSACGCRSILSSVEQLGILLAALSHDVDHPGVNNAFLRASLHPLSIMYNDKAVLENHHAAFAVRTLMELNMYGAGERRLPDLAAAPGVGGTAGGGAPLGSRGEVDDRIVTSFAELRKIVIQAIFSTDMELFRQHHDAMKRRAQMKTTEREELGGEDDRSLLVTCLIHCADICNPVMSGGRNIQWASLVTQEFNAQVDLEKRCGLPVSVFMDSRTELQRTQSQIGFLSFVVLDQFRALADLLPAVSELVVQGEKNLDMWQQCLDALKAAEEAQKEGRPCEELPSNFSFRLKDLKFEGMRGVKCFGFIRSQEFDGYRPPSLDT